MKPGKKWTDTFLKRALADDILSALDTRTAAHIMTRVLIGSKGTAPATPLAPSAQPSSSAAEPDQQRPPSLFGSLPLSPPSPAMLGDTTQTGWDAHGTQPQTGAFNKERQPFHNAQLLLCLSILFELH